MTQTPTPSLWLVYMVRCHDGSLYTGMTNDLSKRLLAHNAGTASRYTRSRLPVVRASKDSQPTRGKALQREAALKKMSRPQKDRLASPAKTQAKTQAKTAGH